VALAALVFLGIAVTSGSLVGLWQPLLGGASQPAAAQSGRSTDAGGDGLLSPFNTSDLQVEPGQLRSGGPPKDGIPSLTNPKTVAVGEADLLDAGDRVVGVEIAGQARAYPLRLLNYHEIVNDRLGDTPIAVIYCPLCDSASVVDRRIQGETLEFGVSGLLMNSNVVFYDRTDQALWSQVGLKALSGPHAGQSLKHLPWQLTTFSAWQETHPDSRVVSLDTGYDRNYRRNPYAGYFNNDRLMFPVEPRDDRLPRKARVIGITFDGVTRAYPLNALAEAGRIEDEIAGQRVVLTHKPEGAHVTVQPDEAKVIHTFWFAFWAFHPDTQLHGHPPPTTHQSSDG
jgi:hypothetical protein